MWLLGIMHVKVDLLNYIIDVRPSEGQILKSTCRTTEIRRIRHKVAIG
jgi:hypothetical protein